MFDSSQKIYAIVCASDFNKKHFMSGLHAGVFKKIIAVDAGYAYVEDVGAKPDAVVGDFDSLGFVPDTDCDIEKYPVEKDQTDLELAISKAVKLGARNIAIYGITGRRLDHEISAIQVLAKFANDGLNIVSVGIKQAYYVMSGPGRFSIDVPDFIDENARIFSMFSLSDKCSGIASAGLKWPYKDTLLSNTTSLGVSNLVEGDKVSVCVKQGSLMLVFSSELFCYEFA